MPLTIFGDRVDETLRARADDAVRVLREGGVVAIPTDTVYGLAAVFDDENAVERLFRIKARPPQLAIPLLLDDSQSVHPYVSEIPDMLWALTGAFWPGPLTVVLPKSDTVSNALTGGRSTIGLRTPDHWVPRYIAECLGKAITGTSANRSGSPPLTTANAVEEQLAGEVDMIVDGGPAKEPISSTVVDLCGNHPSVLRAGKISDKEIDRVVLAR